jgi:hypothetical protein
VRYCSSPAPKEEQQNRPSAGQAKGEFALRKGAIVTLQTRELSVLATMFCIRAVREVAATKRARHCSIVNMNDDGGRE